MSSELPGPPPLPPGDLTARRLPVHTLEPGVELHRIHRTRLEALYFGRPTDPARRQRWDAPDAGYGVCYLAEEAHIAFAETLLRDLRLASVHLDDLAVRALNRIKVVAPLRLVELNGPFLRRVGADASVVHARYEITQAWSAALYAHPERPDGIRYRARHDDSGLSVALFDRAAQAVRAGTSLPLSDPSLAPELARWLDRYQVGLTS